MKKETSDDKCNRNTKRRIMKLRFANNIVLLAKKRGGVEETKLNKTNILLSNIFRLNSNNTRPD